MTISPSDGVYTPERVLISVDLPAPLSPSRQCTSLALTVRETPVSATTGPKNLVTFLTSMRGRTGRDCSTAAMSALPRHAATDHVVEEHGGQQHGAEEDPEPVVGHAGKQDAHLHHAEDQRAEAGTDDRAIAAG